MFGNLKIGKGWGQFTNIFVLEIRLFCDWTPNPTTFVVIWGIGNCEFHRALYISFNFHQTFIFSAMDQCPPDGMEVAKY